MSYMWHCIKRVIIYIEKINQTLVLCTNTRKALVQLLAKIVEGSWNEKTGKGRSCAIKSKMAAENDTIGQSRVELAHLLVFHFSIFKTQYRKHQLNNASTIKILTQSLTKQNSFQTETTTYKVLNRSHES